MKKLIGTILLFAALLTSRAVPFVTDVFDMDEYRPGACAYAPVKGLTLFESKNSDTSILLGLGDSKLYGTGDSKRGDKDDSVSLLDFISERGLFFYLQKKF